MPDTSTQYVAVKEVHRKLLTTMALSNPTQLTRNSCHTRMLSTLDNARRQIPVLYCPIGWRRRKDRCWTRTWLEL